MSVRGRARARGGARATRCVERFAGRDAAPPRARDRPHAPDPRAPRGARPSRSSATASTARRASRDAAARRRSSLPAPGAARRATRASRIPSTGEPVAVRAPLPPDLAALLARLREIACDIDTKSRRSLDSARRRIPTYAVLATSRPGPPTQRGTRHFRPDDRVGRRSASAVTASRREPLTRAWRRSLDARAQGAVRRARPARAATPEDEAARPSGPRSRRRRSTSRR